MRLLCVGALSSHPAALPCQNSPPPPRSPAYLATPRGRKGIWRGGRDLDGGASAGRPQSPATNPPCRFLNTKRSHQDNKSGLDVAGEQQAAGHPPRRHRHLRTSFTTDPSTPRTIQEPTSTQAGSTTGTTAPQAMKCHFGSDGGYTVLFTQAQQLLVLRLEPANGVRAERHPTGTWGEKNDRHHNTMSGSG
ncbi:hypothetical protein PMIN03_011143, partial [Paraphaeosphaeria minitans]